jgi:nudix-type nucleoside diphosphatase (YffH/AdpP family)
LDYPKEVYDRGNGSAILLYNTKQKTVILTRQFRLPTYLNGNKTGMMIEVCAGMLDQDNAEQCVIRETEEETGYRLYSSQDHGNLYVSWRRN